MDIFKKISLYLCILLISFKISAVITDPNSQEIFDDNDFNIFIWEHRQCVISIVKLGLYKKNEESMDYLVEAIEKIDFDSLSIPQQKNYNKFAELINSYSED